MSGIKFINLESKKELNGKAALAVCEELTDIVFFFPIEDDGRIYSTPINVWISLPDFPVNKRAETLK